MPAAGSTVRTACAGEWRRATLAGYKVEKDEHRRWLSVPKPPEQVWPLIVSFWQDLGFTLMKNDAIRRRAGDQLGREPRQAAAGHHPQVARFVARLGCIPPARWTSTARAWSARPTGSEIFVTHKGMTRCYTNPQKDFTGGSRGPADPEMRTEILSKLLVKLGASETIARNAVENPVSAAPKKDRARVLTDKPAATLEVDDNLDRAWRRVGIALDRSGFTVEDRDRAAGLYFVRYVDPKTAGQDATTGFFAKLFGGSSDTSGAALKYQVSLKSEGSKTIVSVLNSQGTPDAGENSQRIATLLADELK